MKEQFTPESLGKQLRCPSGEYAKEVGENMFLSNSNMIFKTIDSLTIQPRSKILEIGFGNGKHLPYLFGKSQNLNYTGVDISEEMVREATQNNTELINSSAARFLTVKSGEKLQFQPHTFDYCFTVNTIYFIESPISYFEEIARALNPEGKIAIGFIEKEFGEKLSFTQEGFNFYAPGEIRKWLEQIRFTDVRINHFAENTTSKDGQKVTRPFIVISAVKK